MQALGSWGWGDQQRPLNLSPVFMLRKRQGLLAALSRHAATARGGGPPGASDGWPCHGWTRDGWLCGC